jgi:hypothetical protein
MAEASIGWSRASNMAGARDRSTGSSHLSNERGIENPAQTFNAIHDATQQLHGLLILNSYSNGKPSSKKAV